MHECLHTETSASSMQKAEEALGTGKARETETKTDRQTDRLDR